MRTSVLCLAGALALCLVLPLCSARPDVVSVKKQSAQSAKASSSAEEASSEQIIKKAGCGCGCGCGCGKGASIVASKKKSAKSLATSASSSSSSYEAKKVDGKPCIGLITRPQKIIAKCGCKLLTEAEIKEKYAQLKGESLDAYFKRIVAKSYSWTSTTKSYVKTLSIVWKDFASLDLWYNKKYISLVKEFYTNYYAKQDSETWETYYSRITKKEVWETDDLFARRITIVRDCFPTLDLWVSEKWFNKYTRSLYALEFKRFAEESEADYIKRIFEKDSFFDLSDEIWAKRIFFIQEATISNCDLWYNKAYLSYFKSFYTIWYKKQENESADAWLIRVLSPLPNESLDNAIKRISFIKEFTADWGFWKIEYFKKVQEAKCLQKEWLIKVQKAFFPCGCGGAVTVERSASSKSSAASAASSSESSEYSKVVKA